MTMLNKFLMAALVGGAIGFAVPAGAQSTTYDADDGSSTTVITRAPIDTKDTVVVARADGSTVTTERVVRRRVVVPTSCNFSDRRSVSGGIGGAIGGRMILGTTAADDVPIPGNCGPIPR